MSLAELVSDVSSLNTALDTTLTHFSDVTSISTASFGTVSLGFEKIKAKIEDIILATQTRKQLSAYEEAKDTLNEILTQADRQEKNTMIDGKLASTIWSSAKLKKSVTKTFTYSGNVLYGSQLSWSNL